MINRTPYTYLLGWKNHNKWYYGVRFAAGCNPDELGKTYFSSSKHVKEMIECYGNPDIIEIRNTFKDIDSARNWESKVLGRMSVISSDKWINKTDNVSIDITSAIKGASKPKSDKMKTKLSETRKSMRLTISPKNLEKMAIGKRNGKHGPGIPRPHQSRLMQGNKHLLGKRMSEETKLKMKNSRYSYLARKNKELEGEIF